MPEPVIREAELDELMSRLAGGDRTAFDDLYRALRPRALRAARLQLGDADAQDIAQRALERVFARASDFEPGRACLPWVYAIIANEVRADRRRHARLVLDADRATEVVASDPDAEAQLLERELERALDAAIAELDADSATAIASLLGRGEPPVVKPATLRKRLSRAYAKLRILLGSDHLG